MENKIGAVKEWVNSYIIDQLLIPGDYFVVVAFYGKADVIISQIVKDDADKKTLKNQISQIRGNGRFTDIGNALDVLKAQIALREADSKEKYILLLTDGIQEAPPGSKYYSKRREVQPRVPGQHQDDPGKGMEGHGPRSRHRHRRA